MSNEFIDPGPINTEDEDSGYTIQIVDISDGYFDWLQEDLDEATDQIVTKIESDIDEDEDND